MAGHPVLDGQDRGWGLGIFEKERIMADTEAQEDIEFCFGLVQDFSLIDGVTHGFIPTLINLFFVPNSDGSFRDPAGLAEHGNYFESLGF